ncbi:MAG: TIGR04255 family protein [Candidatus Hydrogenedentes bacterium]|nr:TIGR04255 family protein [Candidatus Hydrogenedentota bacterium]
MSEPHLKLASPPIIEAVLDIDCDLPPDREFTALETEARERYHASYPGFETRFMFEHEFETQAGIPSKTSTRHGIQGYLFRSDDGRQLVQVRNEGFTFNRLSPYSSLDDYMPEIARTWRIFVEITSPVSIRVIRLRFINRILLPLELGKVELNDYLTVGPRLPSSSDFTFTGFLNQSLAIEKSTGSEVKTTLTSQPIENGKLPVIFDIIVAGGGQMDCGDWSAIASKIRLLRSLKNRIFRDTLTGKCLLLFQ